MYFCNECKSCIQRQLAEMSDYLSCTGSADSGVSLIKHEKVSESSESSESSFASMESAKTDKKSQQSSGSRGNSIHKRPNRRRRYRRVPSPRIIRLSHPRYYTPQFNQPSRWQRCRGPEAVRLDTHHVDKTLSTRLEQLSLPPVRILRSARNEHRYTLDTRRVGNINRHLQKSLFTLYTRLANVQMPKECHKICINWSKHNAWLKQRASPKMPLRIKESKLRHLQRTVAQTKLERPSPAPLTSPPYDIVRLQRLAIPKTANNQSSIHLRTSAVPISALKYTMSKRMITLATPYKPPADDPLPEYERCAPVPKLYQDIGTVGIAKLSQPRVVRKRWIRADAASVVFTVSAGARKYKPSPRMQALCKPRPQVGESSKANPYAVKKSALITLKPKKEAYFRKLAGLKLQTKPQKN